MENEKQFYHALDIDPRRCTACSHCLHICPTEAIRIRNSQSVILENRCIDCGKCYSVCPTKAIYIKQDDFLDTRNYPHSVVLIPSVFLSQFPDDIRVSRIYAALNELGFRHVYEVESATSLYTEAKRHYAEQHPDIRPLISGFCPAIVRLIQVKYPSLVENIIPIHGPLDLSARYIRKKLIDEGVNPAEIGLFYVTPCAAKIAAIKKPEGEKKSIVDGVLNMDSLFNRVYRLIKEQGHNYQYPTLETPRLSSDAILSTLTNGERRLCSSWRSYAIDGIDNVQNFLDRLENGSVEDVDFLELRSCDQSCAGAILACDDQFLCAERMYARANKAIQREKEGLTAYDHEMEGERDYILAHAGTEPLHSRSMMILDPDISVALEKLERINMLSAKLPQVDCGLCGAPSCNALATDVVCNNCQISDCIFVQRQKEEQGEMSVQEGNRRLKEIWGDNRLGNI
ncbi:MAG: 4Fe-4S binding protein [Bacteroidales bacterium]|nr:4Fe-4S binding protein [Bacteroidales bacterium]